MPNEVIVFPIYLILPLDYCLCQVMIKKTNLNKKAKVREDHRAPVSRSDHSKYDKERKQKGNEVENLNCANNLNSKFLANNFNSSPLSAEPQK